MFPLSQRKSKDLIQPSRVSALLGSAELRVAALRFRPRATGRRSRVVNMGPN